MIKKKNFGFFFSILLSSVICHRRNSSYSILFQMHVAFQTQVTSNRYKKSHSVRLKNTSEVSTQTNRTDSANCCYDCRLYVLYLLPSLNNYFLYDLWEKHQLRHLFVICFFRVVHSIGLMSPCNEDLHLQLIAVRCHAIKVPVVD